MSDNEGIQTNKIQGGSAKVIYSVFSENSPDLVGLKVSDARKKFTNLWNIDAQATAFQGKEQLADDHVIAAGEQITFMRRQGEKGSKALNSLIA